MRALAGRDPFLLLVATLVCALPVLAEASTGQAVTVVDQERNPFALSPAVPDALRDGPVYPAVQEVTHWEPAQLQLAGRMRGQQTTGALLLAPDGALHLVQAGQRLGGGWRLVAHGDHFDAAQEGRGMGEGKDGRWHFVAEGVSP